MKVETSGVLGHLVDIKADYFIAELKSGPEGFLAEKMIGMDKVKIGQIGSYLMVKESANETLCMVERIWKNRDSSGCENYMLRLAPLGELDRSGNFARGINHYPTIGAELQMVSNWSLEKIFSDHSEEYYKVGKLSSFDAIDIYFDASNFFGRHVAILGQSGSGKSWAVTSLIQSALRYMPNAHIIIMDLHGEYGENKNDLSVSSPFPPSKVRCLDTLDLEIPYWLLTFSDLAELLIMQDDVNASLQYAHLRSVLGKLKKEANKHLDLGHISVDSPVYFSLQKLLDEFVEENEKTTDFGSVKGPLNGKFDQFLVRLNSLLNDSRYDFMLKPIIRTSTESMTDLMRDFVGLGTPKANVTVLNLSAVPIDVAPVITAMIGRLAFEFNYWNPKCLEFPIWLVCEEAHDYIPRAEHTRFREARRSMERIAKSGRKYGVGLCVVSQRPHEVSETVLAQCGSYLCLHLSNPDDQEYVRSMVPDAARGTFAALSSLARGEVVAMGVAVPMPVRFKVNLPNPPPNSSDIDYAEKWNKGGGEIDVEGLVANWHRQIR